MQKNIQGNLNAFSTTGQKILHNIERNSFQWSGVPSLPKSLTALCWLAVVSNSLSFQFHSTSLITPLFFIQYYFQCSPTLFSLFDLVSLSNEKTWETCGTNGTFASTNDEKTLLWHLSFREELMYSFIPMYKMTYLDWDFNHPIIMIINKW